MTPETRDDFLARTLNGLHAELINARALLETSEAVCDVFPLWDGIKGVLADLDHLFAAIGKKLEHLQQEK